MSRLLLGLAAVAAGRAPFVGYVPRDPEQLPGPVFKNTSREQVRRVKQLLKQQEGPSGG